jgi:hypothetical protein
MVSIESILDVVPALGVIVALIYYSLTLRNTSRARQRELIFQRLQGYSIEFTKAFADIASYTDWEDAEDFTRKYGMQVNPEAWAKYVYILRAYNFAGILLKERVAEADLIFKLYPPMGVISVWEQFEQTVQDTRERRNVPAHMESFEFLYREAKKRYPEILPRDAPY